MARQADVVANTPILATWGNTLRDRSIVPFTGAAERASQWTAPVAGATSYNAATKTLEVFNGTVWVCVTPMAAVVDATGSVASSTYGDISGSAGPAVTVLTGTDAVVTVTSNLSNDVAGNGATMGVAVSGATTVAATTARSLYINVVTTGQNFTTSATFLMSGLTPGSNTFTAKYAWTATAGNAVFSNRAIAVVAVP